MERLGAWVWLVLAGAAIATGCNSAPACKTPGESRSCECAKGHTGTQLCLPERVWDPCMCKATVHTPDASVDAATKAPMTGTGGAGPTGSGGSAQPPPTMTMTMADDDAGGNPGPMSTGGSGGTDAGGSGSGGMSGGDSGTAHEVDAYTTCAMPSDCKPAGSGCVTDPTGLVGSACQPPCKSKNDCPVPAGSYTAVATCTADKLCVLDCSPDSNLNPGTCPGNLVCNVLLDGSFACLSP